MKKTLAATAAIALAAVGFATPAAAYDRDAYGYAAEHMIGYKDIPASLNAKKGAVFNALPGSSNYVCGDSEKTVQFPGGEHDFFIAYNGKRGTDGVNVMVSQYASSKKAIAAFEKLKTALERCEGPKSGQENYGTDDDPQIDTWSRLTTTGVVPLVTVAGVESVFINDNYEDVTSGTASDRYTSDTYNVYTLVNDVIINTSRSTGSELNMPTKERRAVNQVAFNAVTRWVD